MAMEIIISMVLLVVGVGVLLVVHICVVGRAFNEESDEIGDNILSQRSSSNNSSVKTMREDDLQKLPCFDFVGAVENSNPVVCIVCLDNFVVGDHCRPLPNCEHTFHAQCIDVWLLKAPVCPICRSSATLVKVDMSEESDTPVDIVIDLT